eukprot:jgi/Tetstr1/426813/TSEL_017028.t1
MSDRGGGCGPPPPATADNGAREQLRNYRDARRLDWGSERFYRATAKDVAPKTAGAAAALLGGALLLGGAGVWLRHRILWLLASGLAVAAMAILGRQKSRARRNRGGLLG